jgi:hypothetical protein
MQMVSLLFVLLVKTRYALSCDHKLDHTNQPFLKTTKRLYLLTHINGAPQSWQLLDISPESAVSTVMAFDMAMFGGKIYLVAATKQKDGTSLLYTCTLPIPKFGYDTATQAVIPDVKSMFRISVKGFR